MRSNEPILTISVAADLLNLHPRSLMLYEKVGLLYPHRTVTKRRMFSIKDLDRLQFVKFLTREKGLNLQGVKILLEAIELTGKEGVDLKKLLFPTFKPNDLI